MQTHQTTLFALPVARSLRDVIADYLESCYTAGCKANTITLYASNLNHWREYVAGCGCITVRAVSPAVCNAYFAEMQRADLSDWTVDSRWRSLHTFFEWCVWQEVLEANPLDKVRRPRRPKPKDRRVPRLSRGEFERVIEVTAYTKHNERNEAIVWLLGDSGLRRGEVAALNVYDIRRDHLNIWDAKGDKDRAVPISVESRLALKRWLRIRSTPETPALFTSRGRRITGGAIYQMVHKLREPAGLDRLYPHLLRHTFAQHYLQSGGDLRTLSDILGHEDVETTAMIYTEPNTRLLVSKHRQHAPSSRMKRR